MTAQEVMKRQNAEVARRDKEQDRYYQPPTDIRETEAGVDLRFDMPGVGSEHVQLTVEKDTLTVTGLVDPEVSGTAVYRETHVGNYRREFTLSEDVDADHIKAEMKEGVLNVHIPKPEKVQPRRIEIACT